VDAGHRPPPCLRERYGFAAILLFYILLSLLLFNQVEEDAFSYFRLVDNLVHGYGIVFNRGGEVVEAGSSLLWFLLLVLLWRVPLELVISAKLLGLLMGGVVLWLVLRMTALPSSRPLDYLFGLRPDLVLINSFVVFKQPEGAVGRLARDPRLARDYQLRYVLAGLVLVYEQKGAHPRPQPDTPAGLAVRSY
jgi:hypothetical protein